ncbi:MAG: RIP metalloprotease RseP [Pedosphaera sp.]|nr:RIP metalloprotease RseP [Pedosphaera sp.]
MSILKIIFTVFEALLALNLLIFVHELGHFFAARWRGLRVDRFAIWFGKPIWKKTINGVEYALGWIPAGGYVALPQMASMEMIEGKGESTTAPLPNVTALDKIIVAFAGPLFSFLLAIAFAFVVWGVGKPEQRSKDSTTVGWVDPTGPAYKAGLRPGDKILEVDGHAVTQFAPPSRDSITWRIVTSENATIAIKYSRDGKEGIANAVPFKRATKWYERKALRQILVAPTHPAIIALVATNSPAAVAGLRTNDEVIAINGERIYSFASVIWAEEMLTNGPVKPVRFTIKRGSEQFEREILAEKPVKPAKANPSFGILAWALVADEEIVHPAPLDQIRESAGQIFATIGTVFSSKSDVSVQQLGGAVMIIRVYKNFFESDNGWRRVLWFSVILNVNLALLNLLPLPVLDGGHITLALIEAIRRRPVSPRLLNYIQSGFAVLLIIFMLYIGFFDTGDWVRAARADRDIPVLFAPK